ncbi:uncharacterized protein BO96DRAFT_436526 [Aspergillus niger CBS 101883]|uniref:uncharacterized protein n=1 Tax=Aspergillus lacticoffeatus (strain CBS 101883) TaxID=1450533 RepID=UPI000D804256|nr:uncharacterized protein BO96DRAFT_436526 [Aspergillus niger CBS 101883]PYH54042.1 hypothetical protein BO96DRAFT_436526 [Aspergillus niger CBS 101883]
MRLKFRPRDRHAAGRSRICRGLVACAEVAYFSRQGGREDRLLFTVVLCCSCGFVYQFGVHSAGDILAFYGSGPKCDQGPNICINFGTKVHGALSRSSAPRARDGENSAGESASVGTVREIVLSPPCRVAYIEVSICQYDRTLSPQSIYAFEPLTPSGALSAAPGLAPAPGRVYPMVVNAMQDALEYCDSSRPDRLTPPRATKIATFPVADCVGVLTPGKAEFLLGDSLGTGPTDLN